MRPIAVAQLTNAPAHSIHRVLRHRLSCALVGHHVDNRAITSAAARRLCRCGEAYLARDGSLTRVRHTLSCFLGHHSYEPLIDRDHCREYVCVQCGHPLLFRDSHDPYRQTGSFKKKVRYLCGLFGHRVAAITERAGSVEYACHCGHTFLKTESQIGTIRHPLVCVALGHFVRYVTTRGGYEEFLCVNCGHPFCFRETGIRDQGSGIRDQGSVKDSGAPRSARAPAPTARQAIARSGHLGIGD